MRALAAAACLVSGCSTPGVLLHLASDVSASSAGAPSFGGSANTAAPSSYCVGLTAGGTRRFGRRYETAQDPLPQSLGVRADGQSTMVARLDGLVDGLRTRSSALEVPTTSGSATLTLASCVPVTAGSFAQRDVVALSAGRLALLHTGLEPAGAMSFVALSPANGVLAHYEGGALVQVTAPSGGGQLESALALDVDGDCADDLVVAADGNPVAVWSDHTDGTLVPDASRLDEQSEALGLAVGDLNGDGWADLVKVGDDGGVVLLSDRARGFSQLANAFAITPTGATAVAIGDVDMDGVPDVVIGFSDGPLRWAKGDGKGGFTGATALPGTFETAAVLLVDVNGDGALDVLAGVSDAMHGLHVLLHESNGTFTDSTMAVPTTIEANVVALTLADVDGDCVDELVVVGATLPPRILGLGATLSDRGPIGTSAARAVGAGDLDGDGRPEVVLLGTSAIEIFGSAP